MPTTPDCRPEGLSAGLLKDDGPIQDRQLASACLVSTVKRHAGGDYQAKESAMRQDLSSILFFQTALKTVIAPGLPVGDGTEAPLDDALASVSTGRNKCKSSEAAKMVRSDSSSAELSKSSAQSGSGHSGEESRHYPSTSPPTHDVLSPSRAESRSADDRDSVNQAKDLFVPKNSCHRSAFPTPASVILGGCSHPKQGYAWWDREVTEAERFVKKTARIVKKVLPGLQQDAIEMHREATENFERICEAKRTQYWKNLCGHAQGNDL